MRRLALLVAAALAAAPVAADDLEKLTLTVGEKRQIGGRTPICDDPAVAVISADGAGVLEAKAPGETICSIDGIGSRRVFHVKVVPRGASGGAQGGNQGGGAPAR